MKLKYKIGTYVLVGAGKENKYDKKYTICGASECGFKIKSEKTIKLEIIGYNAGYYALHIPRNSGVKSSRGIDSYMLYDYKINRKYAKAQFVSLPTRYILGRAIKLQCKECRRYRLQVK